MMNKRGVFFTVAAILIIIVLFAFYSGITTSRYQEKSNVVTTRVSSMNDFLIDVESDLDRELYIGGYRAILSMNKFIREEEDFIDVQVAFRELLFNGTINSTDFGLMGQGLQGADIFSWEQRINEEASKLNIDLDVEFNDIYLTQESPWSIIINANLTINLTDSQGLASWDFNKLYTHEMSIVGFEDPLYTVSTSDKVFVVINRSYDFDFVDDVSDANDTSMLKMFINNSMYINSTRAPSFLMRFEGNLSASPYGIESLIDLDMFHRQNLEVKNKTLVDFRYFDDTYPADSSDRCNVQNMPYWFRIDPSSDDSYELYEIDELESDICG